MDQLKSELRKLTDMKESIETDIAERSQRINGPGQPGMDGPLTDAEGFPRADIDIAAIRTDRNAIIRLTNDHKQVTLQLEQLLHKLHALARESGLVSGRGAAGSGATPPETAAAAAPAPATAAASDAAAATPSGGDGGPAATAAAAAAAAAAAVSLRPFAVVDEVAEGSPAHEAGVRLGDQLCKFGTAVAGSGSELQEVAQQLQQHEGTAVEVVFLRQGQPEVMQLVPRKWQGRGLLGCHLKPL